MDKLFLALTRVALKPERASRYSPFSLDDPQEPYLDSRAILALYVAALTPFWVGAAIVGLGLTKALALSTLIWVIGFLLGTLHVNFGLLAILALGLLSLVNENLHGMALMIPDGLWSLGLLLIYLPLSLFLQALAGSRKKALYRFLQFVLTVIVGGVGLGAFSLSNQPTELTKAHLWTTVTLAALSLLRRAELEDGEALNTISIFIAFVAGVGTSWQLYPLIFPPDNWNWWLRMVQVIFSAFVPFLVLGTVIGNLEVERELDQNGPLLFFLFVALSPSISIPYALLVGLLASALMWLAFPMWPKFQKGTSISTQITVTTTCAALFSLVSTMFVTSSDYRMSSVMLFLAQFPPGLHLLWLFIAVGVLFSLSGLHWTAFLTAAGVTLGPILLGQDTLLVALGLLGSGVFLGATRILLWPFLSLLIWWQRNQIQQSTNLEKEVYFPAVTLAEVLSWPKPAGSDSLLVALAEKGLREETFEKDSVRQAYRSAQSMRYAQAIGSASSLQEALQMEVTLVSENPVSSAIQEFRAAELPSGDIRRVREYARTIHQLRTRMEAESKEATKLLKHEVETLNFLIHLAHREVRRSVGTYWNAYDLFSDFGQVDMELASLTDRGEIQRGIELCLSKAVEMSEKLSAVQAHVGDLPSGEQRCLREIEDISRQLRSLPREVDYVARARLIQDALSRVNKMRHEMEPVWRTIDRDADRVIEHENPWMAFLDSFEASISCLDQLNDRIIEWATMKVVDALRKIERVEELGSLAERMGNLSGFHESYGPIVDTTIQSLEGIGRDATAALAFPRGYNRRLGLQDTLDRVNRLRSDLSTRFLLETKEIVEHLERVAQVLYDHLYAVSDRPVGDYRNPYIAGNPISLDRASLFKGRLDLARSIVTLLRSRGNPTVILYGPRRMGKTSFLLQLPRLLPSDYLPVFLDMQQGGAQQSDGSFTYALAYAIWKQLRKENRVPRPDLDEHERHPYTAMEVWLDDIQPVIGERILFFTIDEFEAIGRAIERGTLTIQVLGHLRSLMQHNDNLNLMFAGVQTIDALGPDPASYFISAHPVEIGYLHPKEAEDLVRNPDPRAGKMPVYNDEVISHLLRITHCQPYLVQAICSEIIQIANEQQLARIEMSTLDQATAGVLATSLFFQNIWDDAGKEGWKVLKRLAAGSATLDELEINEDVVEGLLRRHVIRRTDGMYTVEIPLVRDWIQRELGTE